MAVWVGEDWVLSIQDGGVHRGCHGVDVDDLEIDINGKVGPESWSGVGLELGLGLGVGFHALL